MFPQNLKKIIKLKLFFSHSIHGKNLKVGSGANCYSKKKENIKIGDNCEIYGILSANGDGKITIGNFTTIRHQSVIGCINSIDIGDYCIISNNVHIYDNNNHPIDPKKRREMCKSGFNSEKWDWKYSDNKPIAIKDNVWIGERATILKGVTIGEGAIIASNSVVTKNVPSFTIVAGNPAKIVKVLDS